MESGAQFLAELEAAPEEDDGVAPQPVQTEAGRGGSSRPVGSGRQGRSGGTAGVQPRIRGANWTEAESLILINQRRQEYEKRHHPQTPTAQKSVYGKDAWKTLTDSCNAMAGFRERDVDQITNKWDSLSKEFKKIKDYLNSCGGEDWWGLSKLEKKVLSKVRRLPLEFTEAMFNAMEGWHAHRVIFQNRLNIIDSDRPRGPIPTFFGRRARALASQLQCASPAMGGTPLQTPGTPPSFSQARSSTPLQTPWASSTPDQPPQPPHPDTPGNNESGDDEPSAGLKRKLQFDQEYLVDFIKDFNHNYLARAEAQDLERQAWRATSVALEKKRETRLAKEYSNSALMDDRWYQLEVMKLQNMGNLTNALLKMATTLQTLVTRGMIRPSRSDSRVNNRAGTFAAGGPGLPNPGAEGNGGAPGPSESGPSRWHGDSVTSSDEE